MSMSWLVNVTLTVFFFFDVVILTWIESDTYTPKTVSYRFKVYIKKPCLLKYYKHIHCGYEINQY